MSNKEYSPAFLRKRKMMMVLPVLVLPFLTLAFWSLGGGRNDDDAAGPLTKTQGLNYQLPDAHLKDDKALNKLSYYQEAARDSAKREELVRKDPYFKLPAPAIDTDQNEQKLYAKLAALDRELNKNAAVQNELPAAHIPDRNAMSDVDRLESMLNTIQSSGKKEDPEMKELSGMLDKIMDIQHPDRINEQARKNSILHGEQAYPVSMQLPRQNVSLLVSDQLYSSRIDTIGQSEFFSIASASDPAEGNSIEAVVHETRTLVNGSVVKLRLLNAIYINGQLIPKGSFVFGIASLNGERLLITVKSIRWRNSILPVALNVFDMDGIDGVFIPGAITRDVAKESSDRSIQGIALNSLDPSIGAQAASAGIEAAKSLLQRKVKLIKVTVKAGYKILLKEKKTN